jgi:hypothetical protein
MHTSRRTYTVHHHVQSWFRGEGGNGDFTEQQLHHREHITAIPGARAASIAGNHLAGASCDAHATSQTACTSSILVGGISIPFGSHRTG